MDKIFSSASQCHEFTDSLLKPRYKDFGACSNLGGLQAPKLSPKKRWVEKFLTIEFNTLGWNRSAHLAYLETESEVQQ